MTHLEERPTALQELRQVKPQVVRHDLRRYVRNVAIGVGIWLAITVPLACAASMVEAQVLGEGPVIAPTPLPTVRVIHGDPMPRLYLDYYMPFVGKGE